MKAIIWDFNGTLANSSKATLYPDAKQILEKCSKKYKQALITTKLSDPEGRKKLINDLGIWDYFDFVRISRKTTEIFMKVCEEFNCKPKEVFVIGDGFRYGPFLKEIAVGNKLGMKTIWVDFNKTSNLSEKLQGIKYWKKVNKLKDLYKLLDIK